MASCITTQWGDTYSPQARLTVTQTASTNTNVTLSWTLEYVAHGYAIYTSVTKAYTVKINGKTVKSGSYAVNGVTSTHTIASGTTTVNKTTSTQNISFSISFTFGANWSGTYSGTRSASGTISVAAKPSYKITYSANGGSGAPSAQTKWYGTNLTLSSTKPTRTGYTFLGWSTTSTATTATWAAGGTYTANASDTLYAVWKANTYTVSYNANGGTGAPASQTKTYGKTLTLSSTKPTRTNYTFKGWGVSASSTTVSYAAGASYTNNASVTLYAIWVLAYTAPRITNVAVDRCDSAGTLTEEGTYAKVSFKWATDKTVSSITIEWKLSTSASYASSTTVTASGTTGTVSKIIGANALNTEDLYDVRITVKDASGSSSTTKEIPQMFFILDFLKGGRGLSIGKPAEIAEWFDVGLVSRFRNSMYLENPRGIYGYTPDGTAVIVFEPQSSTGNLVVGRGLESLKEGAAYYLSGTDLYLGVGGTRFRPYYREGSGSISVTVATGGFVTTSGKEVFFTVSLAQQIIGSPSITVSTLDGFQIRQNGKYLYGSSADTYAKPSSYRVTNVTGNYIRITAVFSNATNVENNGAVGIYWSGKITF